MEILIINPTHDGEINTFNVLELPTDIALEMHINNVTVFIENLVGYILIEQEKDGIKKVMYQLHETNVNYNLYFFVQELEKYDAELFKDILSVLKNYFK